MFEQIRVQILFPCRGKCAWCSTRHKNPLFQQLYVSGISERVHRFYLRAITSLRPNQVFVSGGEPLLYPGIAGWLNAIAGSTTQINVFTSFQYTEQDRAAIPFDQMPLDKVVLCHTSIYFAPRQWHTSTDGFPFDLYVENIRSATRLPVRKQFKFILNHAALDQEIRLFQERVSPDRSFQLGLKVVNEQGGRLNRVLIQQTRALVNERAQSLDRLPARAGWGKTDVSLGSLEIMAPLLRGGDVTKCRYRQEPLELRFALYKADHGDQVLKYRYCPYFPSDIGYRFHIGRDNPRLLVRNYFKGDFRDHCSRCRFLEYCE